MRKTKALFFHAACPGYVSAGQQIVHALDPERNSVDEVHPGRQKARITEAGCFGAALADPN